MEIDERKVRYKVIVYTASGTQVNVTNAVKDLGWSESEKELAMKVTFTLLNVTHNGKKLSQIVKLGCRAIIQADWSGGFQTVATSIIYQAVEASSKTAETYQILAYDCLFPLQKSNEDYYKSKGKGTKSLIKDVLKEWGLTIGEYKGPNVTHGKVKFQNKSISDIILAILKEAKEKGGGKSILRTTPTGKVSVVKLGKNDPIWMLTGDNSISSQHTLSATNLVTKVKIMSTSDKKKAPKVQAVVKGDTKFGTFQKLVTHNKNEKMSEAKKEAKEMIKDKPEETSKVESPDVPPMRKGDEVYLKVGSLNGLYIVTDINHDADAGKMTISVKKESQF